MLVLTRKPGERIQIGSNITIKVLEIVGTRIRIGIEAPTEVTVLRSELGRAMRALSPDQDDRAPHIEGLGSG